MIRPLEWTERTSQAAGLTDLTLKVYLPDGSCILDHKAREEAPERYSAYVLFGQVLRRPIIGGPLEDPVAVDGLELNLFIGARPITIAFGHEDGELPLDSEEAQGGLIQQIAAMSSLTAQVPPTGDGAYNLIIESASEVMVLGGTAAPVLDLAVGATNYVRMIGQRVILRWVSVAGDVDERIGVMITGGDISAEVIAAAAE